MAPNDIYSTSTTSDVSRSGKQSNDDMKVNSQGVKRKRDVETDEGGVVRALPKPFVQGPNGIITSATASMYSTPDGAQLPVVISSPSKQSMLQLTGNVIPGNETDLTCTEIGSNSKDRSMSVKSMIDPATLTLP